MPSLDEREPSTDAEVAGVEAPGKRKRDAVIANGERAAREIVAGWDWARFKQDRRGVPPTRQPSARPRARRRPCRRRPGLVSGEGAPGYSPPPPGQR
jgi:hypothetical protein